MLSLLRLNKAYVERLVVKASMAPGIGQQEDYKVVVSHSTPTAQTGGNARILHLTVRLRPSADGDDERMTSFDEIAVSLLGVFAFADDATDDDKAKLFPVNAVSILFGLARGVIAQATGMCPAGSFMLPPVNVVAAAKKRRLVGECSLKLGCPYQVGVVDHVSGT